MFKRLILGLIIFTPLAFAEAPVVDLSDQVVDDEVRSQPLSMEQRLQRLEQQLSNTQQMSLPGQIDKLQQDMQQLMGKIEVEQHQLQQLQEQVKNFYQDLDHRVTELKPQPEAAKDDQDDAPPNLDTAQIADKEQQLYQTAFDELQHKQHITATKKFKDYLAKYPKGQYIASANYWLGEINFTMHQYKSAEKYYKVVILKHPKSDKVADARLRLGLVYQKQHKAELAKSEFNKLIRTAPHSLTAKLAKRQLKNMKR